MSTESFWTIGFRRIINKRSKNDSWVLCENGGLIRISSLKSIEDISWKLRFDSYTEAHDKLTMLRDKAKDRDPKLIKRLKYSKEIYVESNTKG